MFEISGIEIEGTTASTPCKAVQQAPEPPFAFGPRPIANAAGPLHSIHIVAREGRVLRAPRPEVSGELVERFRARLAGAALRIYGGQQCDPANYEQAMTDLHDNGELAGEVS